MIRCRHREANLSTEQVGSTFGASRNGHTAGVETPVATQYTPVDGCQIAYQVHGSGPVDMLFIDGWIGCIELDWDDPAYARLLRRDGRFARVIRYDGRGSGMSDPDPSDRWPILDAWVRDAIGVLDAVGSQRCAVYGNGLGGPVAIRLAAAHPGRVDSLVLANTFARLREAPDQLFGLSEAAVELAAEAVRIGWGGGVMLDLYGVDYDEATRVRAARYERLSASPATAFEQMKVLTDVDVRADLDAITARTLVIHRPNPVLDIEHGRSMAAAIPNAIFEVEPPDDWSWRGETDEDPPGLARIAEFLTGARHDADPDRVFAAVLFTDIVGSTTTAVALGDRKWRLVINAHDAETQRQVKRSGGRVVESTGAGDLFVATFSSPTRALACATALRDALAVHDITVRIGLHAAEIELRDEQVAGIGVHIAARVNALAEAGEILVTNTVRDLVTGSGLAFTDRGPHTLKGVPDAWNLWALKDS
jgi:Adenylate cyclase, family 3 (some proteins contain HAMP domain)